MTGNKVKFGLTLPNRGVVIGATTVAEMLQLAADAESEGWDSVWVGDSIFAKPQLDAIVLLGAIAARTTRVRRRIDDLQHLDRRGLLLQRFGKFSLTLGKATSQIGDKLFGIW
jgi:hypothetical protein